MGLGMTKLFSVFIILTVSSLYAQNKTLTSKIDTVKYNEVTSNEVKRDSESKPLSLTYLKMSTPLSSLTLNPNALYYSQTFVLPGQFNAPNNSLNVYKFLSPLRVKPDPTQVTIRKILGVVGTAAAIGVAAAHVKKYWKDYKDIWE